MNFNRLLIFILSVITFTDTTGVGGTTNGPPSRTLYTDQQAQQFIQKLPSIVFPTSISSACELLGIDLARLGINETYPPEYSMAGLGTGSTETHMLQLSDSYAIEFLHNINDTNRSRHVIFKVEIRNFRRGEK